MMSTYLGSLIVMRGLGCGQTRRSNLRRAGRLGGEWPLARRAGLLRTGVEVTDFPIAWIDG